MTLRRIGLLGWLALLPAASLCAQPQYDLQAAVEQLWKAGNYSWDERSSFDSGAGDRPASVPRPTGTGQTEIGGFTVAAIQTRQVVFHGGEAAFKVNEVWRRADDLTDSEIADLRFITWGTGRGRDRARAYIRSLPHEIFQTILQYGVNVRKEGTAILGDLDDSQISTRDLEELVFRGTPPASAAKQSRGILGVATGILGRRSGARPPPRSGEQVAFIVYLSRGKITEFAIEFLRPYVIGGGEKAGEMSAAARKYTFKLWDIGRTKVEIDPFARELFPAASAAPRR